MNKNPEDLYDDPDFRKFVDRTRRELVPKIEESNVFVSIVPSDGKPDIKFAVELGLGIMYDKPIVAAVPPGVEIPEKLAKVVDRFVELSDDPAETGERLRVVMDEMYENGDLEE